jgi:formate dehydrogenase major subunit
MVQSANRLKWPEVREAGTNEWKKISWMEAFERITKHMKADRDANFVAQNKDGLTVNRWPSTAFLASSAAPNEAGYLTVKTIRAMGMTSIDTQARI